MTLVISLLIFTDTNKIMIMSLATSCNTFNNEINREKSVKYTNSKVLKKKKQQDG